jgi:plastocyanin
MRRVATAFALTATLALALGACASGKDTGLPAGPTTPPVGSVCTGVDMTDTLKFVPENCTIKAGATLVWTNIGQAPHTVTSSDGGKTFDSGDVTHPINGGGRFTFAFKKVGTFPYYCRIHSPDKKTGMIGTVVVQAA